MVKFVMLALLTFWFGVLPNWQIVFLPMFIVLAVLASIGPALWITSLNVKYRHFRSIIPFFIQFGLCVSPVGFSSSGVPEKWRLLYSPNPVVGIIDGFRWCLFGGESKIDWIGFAMCLGVITFFLWFGIRTFRATERTFADMV